MLSGVEDLSLGFIGMDAFGNKAQRQQKRAQRKEEREDKKEQRQHKREVKRSGPPAPGPGGQPPPQPQPQPQPTGTRSKLQTSSLPGGGGPATTMKAAPPKTDMVTVKAKLEESPIANKRVFDETNILQNPNKSDLLPEPEYGSADRAEQSGGFTEMLKNPLVLAAAAAAAFFIFKPK